VKWVFKYEVVAEALRESIEKDAFPEGKLPSTHKLQEQFGASYGSVRTAILILKAEGLIVGRQGDGVYVK
jgi:GntR family transcriptional regulator